MTVLRSKIDVFDIEVTKLVCLKSEIHFRLQTSYFISDLAAGVIEQLAIRTIVFADRTAAVDDNIDPIDYPLCPLDRAVGYRLERVYYDQLGRERRRYRAVDIIFV